MIQKLPKFSSIFIKNITFISFKIETIFLIIEKFKINMWNHQIFSSRFFLHLLVPNSKNFQLFYLVIYVLCNLNSAFDCPRFSWYHFRNFAVLPSSLIDTLFEITFESIGLDSKYNNILTSYDSTYYYYYLRTISIKWNLGFYMSGLKTWNEINTFGWMLHLLYLENMILLR